MKQRDKSKIITISFLGFLAGISIISMGKPQSAFSATENRYLQQKPKFSMEDLLDGSYGEDYETFLSDQFPGRNSWIGVKVLAERIQGKQDVNGVYFGKDDYLIEKFDTERILGEQLEKNMETLLSFVKETEVILGNDHVRVMMVPTASQVLEEKLPWLATSFDQSQITESLVQKLGSDLVISVEDMLNTHDDQDIYYRTDHHWTALGSYYGYQAWAESLGLEPWPQEAFDIQTVSEKFLGTVYSKVNVSHKPDSIQLYLPRVPVNYQIYYDGAKESSQMYRYSALEGKDQYSVYMDGNHGLTKVINETENLDSERKLLIIKDSFAHSFAPFAVNHFAETYMIDLRYFNMDAAEFMADNEITDLLVMYQIPGFAKEKTVSKLLK